MLVQHIEAHGLMDVVLSDRGSHFDAKLINLLCVRLGIKRIRTTPYHPQGNARTERVHRFLNAALGILTSQNGKEWDKYIGAVGFAYRSSPMPGTTLTPYDIFRGWPAKTPLDAAIHDVRALSDDVKAGLPHTERLHQASAAARAVTLLRHESNKAAYDALHKSVQYKPGDKVMVFFPSNYADAGSSAKLAARWTGPYTVVDDTKGVPVGSPDERVVYSVRRDGTDVATRVHVARMKALVERRPPLRRPDHIAVAPAVPSNAASTQPTVDVVGQESPIAELPKSLAG